MSEKSQDISIGIGGKKVPPGTHVCLVYNSQKERIDSFMQFLLSGLQAKERMACFSEGITEKDVREFLSTHGISLDECKSSDAIILEGTRDAYFEKGAFDPKCMLKRIDCYYHESLDMGFSSSRIIGDMVPEIMKMPGGWRLFEYESLVSIFLRDHPVTTMCLYDAGQFDGGTIMKVLRVHPLLIVDGMIIANPFYIKPEDYLRNYK